jgi:hypothetical protein
LPNLKVTFVSETTSGDNVTWKYRVENASSVPAKSVTIYREVLRQTPGGSVEAERSRGTLPTVAPGAKTELVIACAPSPGRPPCFQSSVALTADASAQDAQPGNKVAASWMTPRP